ncbi:biopolymer transporter ExbB [Opitutaceae bacterium TAV5]|nr:biopolymer transporter ExbB [Opitutaceae bacterium TAV5]
MKRATTALCKWMPCLAALLALTSPAHAWWDDNWTLRKQLTVEAPAPEAQPVENAPVLVRLHIGNFSFSSAREDGADLRFVAADDKTPLPYHIAQYDALLGEAFAWVKVPVVKIGEPAKIWLYYGNPAAAPAGEAKATYDDATALVYHFGERGQPARDYSGNENHSTTAGVPVEGSLIGTGVLFDGTRSITIPASESLNLPAGAALTWSAWIKPVILPANAVIYSRRDGASAAFVIGLDQGVPFVEVTAAGRTQRTPASAPLVAGVWQHLSVVAEGSQITVHVGGEARGTLAAALPALATPASLGADTIPGYIGFGGELVELQIAKTARSEAALRFATLSQSGETQILAIGPDQVAGAGAHGGALTEAAQHLFLFGDIAKNMMFDGWIAVFVCIIMIIVGWAVAIGKFSYLNRIHKGTEAFLAQWKQVSTDLTVLDHSNAESVKSFGGTVNGKTQKLIEETPLYHIYHIGSEEIRHRLQNKDGFHGLSSRSMLAIKTKLDSGLTRELHRLNRGLIYLTISIAGGPYVGLLGTVVGVMITFAVIAKTGEVEVNSIAPGIASALLATVAGLLVAIPALFIYSYLNTRIKEMTSNMRMFIDEFVTSMAEFYPTPADRAAPADINRQGKET